MIHGVFFYGDGGNTKHVVVLDIEETLMDEEIIREAATHLYYEPDLKNASVLKANQAEEGAVWLVVSDGIFIDYVQEDDGL